MEGERSRWAGDAELVADLRRAERGAMAELFKRIAPILRREAKRLGVDAAERSTLVDDTLADVLRAIQHPGGVMPRSLVGYCTIALRHAWLSARRRERRHARIARAVFEEQRLHPPMAPPADAGLASMSPPTDDAGADAPDDARPPDVAPTRHARVLQLLTHDLEIHISEEERQILTWLAAYVPQRDIARWQGVKHGAMRVRVHRLRERLRRGALRLGATLAPPERLELERFFRRAGVTAPITPTRRASRGRSATDAETP